MLKDKNTKIDITDNINGVNAENNYYFPPFIDHHQHIFSSTITSILDGVQPITAEDVVNLLDLAGICKAVLLSASYIYGSPTRRIKDEYCKVMAENDWTGEQANKFPDRLHAFLSLNPLKEYALDEIERCSKNPLLRNGIKLHFGNSDVQLDNPEHVKQIQRVFQTANKYQMAIVIHLRPSITKNRPYGTDQTRIFIEQLLPHVPNVPVQVAHLASAGPGYDDPSAHDAMDVLAGAIEVRDSRTCNLFFDVATVANLDISQDYASLITKFIRRVGINRVFYGSDAAIGDNLRPREGWKAFCKLPLFKKELMEIASNIAPYLTNK